MLSMYKMTNAEALDLVISLAYAGMDSDHVRDGWDAENKEKAPVAIEMVVKHYQELLKKVKA